MSQRYTTGKIYRSKPLKLTEPIRRAQFGKVWIRFHEVDHSGPSYEGRVFLNNSKADKSTLRTIENGYAGSFHIFGHGRCYGDEGHCETTNQRRDFDFRSPHQLTPREVELEVSEALRRVAPTSPQLFITVVPVLSIDPRLKASKDCFHFNKLSLVVRSSHKLLAGPIQTDAAAWQRLEVTEQPADQVTKPIVRRKRR